MVLPISIETCDDCNFLIEETASLLSLAIALSWIGVSNVRSTIFCSSVCFTSRMTSSLNALMWNAMAPDDVICFLPSDLPRPLLVTFPFEPEYYNNKKQYMDTWGAARKNVGLNPQIPHKFTINARNPIHKCDHDGHQRPASIVTFLMVVVTASVAIWNPQAYGNHIHWYQKRDCVGPI